MAQHNDPQPLRPYEIRSRIATRVAHYRRNPHPLEHEELLPLIEEHFGEDAAEFFDEEGCLPLTTHALTGKHPLPVHAEHGHFPALFVVSIFTGFFTIIVLTSAFALPLIPATLTGLLLGLAIYLGTTPLLAKLLPPADLKERTRMVNTFAAIQERNKETAQRITEQNTTHAENERANRRLQRTNDPNA